MSFVSRYRWRIGIGSFFAGMALVLAIGLQAFAAEALVQISSDPYTNRTSNHKTQVEPDTFAFGSTVVSTIQSGRFFDGGASNIGFATSTNGGATWTHGFLPSSTVFATPAGPYPRASDPSVAYDAKHNVWMISWLGIKSTSGPVDVLVSRSTDGGLTFGAPVVVNASGDFNDKNWTVCGTSTDGGLKWGAAKTNADSSCVIGGQPLVQPNGTVVVPIDDCFETAILSFRSTDGGKSWGGSVLAAQILNDGHPGKIRAPTLPSAEIDASGRVYVVWSDCRFQNRCAAPIGTNDLLLTSSADGLAWTLPQRIPIDPIGSNADNFIPGLAVDRSTSGSSAHLALAYYFYPNSTCGVGTCQLDVGFISSTNGGRTWSAAEQLAGPMQLAWLPLTTQGFMVGDYISTSIVPHASSAVPVFDIAFAPTPKMSCSNLSTGAPGQTCNEATFTTLEGMSQVTGGAQVAETAAAGTATPSNRQFGLTAPATAQ
ncbi:MAG: exo-alpha-sialidase [Chloroflexi bacterium]|nr:MAG: exo-alpha-sialidase [Chloroflexota bacterium]